MNNLQLILDYEDFKILGNHQNNKYFVITRNNFKWHELQLIKELTDYENFTDEELINTNFDYDFSGENIADSKYLYFKIKRGY